MLVQTAIGLLLDVVMVGLLVTTITYCLKLNRRILVLQDSKGDMAQLIRQFDEATQKASASIADLHDASRKLQDDMGAKLQKANFLADDLAFMIEKGNKVAERMLSSAVQPKGAAAPMQQPVGNVGTAPRPSIGRPAEPGPALSTRGPRIQGEADAVVPAKGSALESVMGRLGGTKGAVEAPRPTNTRNRSKTEQELLEALKNEG